MPAWLLPALLTGGAFGGSLLAGRRTGEEKQALAASTAATRELSDLAGRFADISLPALSAGTDFYRALLGLSPTTGMPSTTRGGLEILPGRPGGGPPGGTLGRLATGGVSGLIGRGRREANKIVPTQESLDRQFKQWGDWIAQKEAAGTATPQDYATAANALAPLREDFIQFATGFGRAGPGATRSTAWQDETLMGWQSKAGEAAAGAGTTSGGGGLVGQRQSIEQLMAVPIQQLTSQYDQIKQNLMQTLPPGGQRDKALADIEQAKARDVGQLFLMGPQIGAQALSEIGLGLAPTGVNALSNLLFGQSGLLQAGVQRAQTGTQLGASIGTLLGNILFGGQAKGGGKTATQGSVQMQQLLQPSMGAFNF